MIKPYQYPKKKRAKKTTAPKPIVTKLTEPAAGPPWIVQGQDATSIEYNVSKALERLELGYKFQYYVFGGRSRRGGGVVDFLVYTPGRKTLLEVNGRYWHTGKHDDELQFQKLKSAYGDEYNVAVIWEEDCLTIEMATTWMRNNLTV